MLDRLRSFFRPKKAQQGWVHIHAPQPDVKSITKAKCPDCKQKTVFVGFHTPWYGWDETCIRCGRHFQDGEWCELNFCQTARIDNIHAALKRWDRSDAELITRTLAAPPIHQQDRSDDN